jgi:hypothetical protein
VKPNSLSVVVQHPVLLAAGVLTVAALLALGIVILWPDEPGAPTCPTGACPKSSLPPAATCPDDLAHNDLPMNDLPMNDLPMNDLPMNGLSAESLTANEDLLAALAGVALTQDVFTTDSHFSTPTIHPLLDPYAPDLVKYIVSCALDPCERVDVPAGDRFAHIREDFPYGFQGQLGLCGKHFHDNVQSDEHLWRTDKPSTACLERVSSCVLARVNAIGASVVFSMRGDGTRLRADVPVQTKFRENHGTPIRSFAGCDVVCLRGDNVRRNCDWEPRHVGQCVRGVPGAAVAAKVHLELREPAGTKGGKHAKGRIRVCDGIYGCDDVGAEPGAGPSTEGVFSNGSYVTFPPYYGGSMIAQDKETVDFECPDNGPVVDGKRTGYYSVMVGSLTAAPLTAGTDVVSTDPASPPMSPAAHMVYPASEENVFTYREGAFFGTLFAAAPASSSCAEDRLLAGPQYACESALWQPAQAAFAARLCAGRPGCFVNAPGQCDATGGCHVVTSALPGQEVYDTCTCTGAGCTDWAHPYTTYLNHPCDLFTSDDGCTPKLTTPTGIPTRKHRGHPKPHHVEIDPAAGVLTP